MQLFSQLFLSAVLVCSQISEYQAKVYSKKFADYVTEQAISWSKDIGRVESEDSFPDIASRKLLQGGAEQPVSVSNSGCQCLNPWHVNGDRFPGVCDNPTNDQIGTYCYVNETTCAQTPYTVRAGFSQEGVFDYCNPAPGTTVSGCECENSWGYGGEQFQGTCSNPDEQEGEFWCFVNEESCDNPPRGDLDGLKWDYCPGARQSAQPTEFEPPYPDATVTNAGCSCVETWQYDGRFFFNGTCSNPDADLGGSWCYVDARTCDRQPFSRGRNGAWDFCTPSPDTTINGCTCRRRWNLFSTSFRSGFSGVCANPDNDPNGPWCIVDPETCKDPAAGPIESQNNLQYDYCVDVADAPSVEDTTAANEDTDEEDIFASVEVDSTIKGCKCRPGASYVDLGERFTFNGSCANPDNDIAGSWCIVDAKTCQYEPQGAFDVDPRGGSKDYWDYCEPPLAPPTQAGCQCNKRWSFPPGAMIDAQFFGVCGNPDNDPSGNWCVVEPQSCTSGVPAGRLRPTDSLLFFFAPIDTPFFDYCPKGAPTMDDFNALAPPDAQREAPSEDFGIVAPSPELVEPIANETSPSPELAEPIVEASPIPKPTSSPLNIPATSSGEPEKCLTVVERLADNEQLSMLSRAVNDTGLTRILNDDTVSATVFAPTTLAFEKWIAQLGYASLDEVIEQELGVLRNVVLYHIIANQRVTAADLSSLRTLTTLFNREAIIITVNPTQNLGVQILGGQNSSANVTLTDITACNSIIHLIDTVLDVPL